MSPHYDWDLDTEIYFGQALLRGELIWTKEFHDKLPLVQYFFFIPGILKSITAWRIISISLMLLAVLLFYILTPKLTGSIRFSKHRINALTSLTGGVYLLISTLLPGGITHINSFAASSAIIATLTSLLILKIDNSRNKNFVLLIISSIFFSISVSFRPYFLYPLVLTFLIVSFSVIRNSKLKSNFSKVSFGCLILFTPLFTTLVFNFAPYIFIGKFFELFEGAKFFIKLPNRNDSLESFLYSLSINSLMFNLFGLTFAFSIFLIAKFKYDKSKSILISLIIPLQFFSLAVGIYFEHWWKHYSNLFAWHFAIILVFGLYLSAYPTDNLRDDLKSKYIFSLKLFFVLSVMILTYFFINNLRLQNYENDINNEVFLTKAINQYFEQKQQAPRNFLAPYNMHSHYFFYESRHGFPHAAHSNHIGEGAWLGTFKTSSFFTPKTIEKYCKRIMRSDIEFIFVPSSSPIDECMSNLNSDFFTLEELYDLRGIKIHVWAR